MRRIRAISDAWHAPPPLGPGYVPSASGKHVWRTDGRGGRAGSKTFTSLRIGLP